MNTIGQRIAEKILAFQWEHLTDEQWRLKCQSIANAEIAPLVEALRKISKLERDDTSPEVFYRNVTLIVRAALAGQEPEEPKDL